VRNNFKLSETERNMLIELEKLLSLFEWMTNEFQIKPALFNYMKVKYDLLQESFNEIIDEAISRKYDDSNEDSFLI